MDTFLSYYWICKKKERKEIVYFFDDVSWWISMSIKILLYGRFS